MRKIFLLQPWYQDRCKTEPYSLLYIKYYLEDHGYPRSHVKIIDGSHHDRELNEVMAMLKEGGDDPIIGVTGYSKERFHAYELIRRIKREIPQAVLVTGGRHFGYLAKETLENMPEVDAVVSGDGEITFKEICDAVNAGKDFFGILGVTHRENGKITQNPPRPVDNDLDNYRMFDPTDLSDEYPMTNPTKVDNRPYFTVFATRGCPFKCTFCSLTAQRPRYRSVDNVLQEIEQKIALTGIRNVYFGDSSLTISKKWMREFCEKVIERDMRLQWNCYSRVDIELELLTLMRRAGIVSAEVALESGSERVLKAIKKSIDIEMFENFCRQAHKLGIKLWVFTIISAPEERLEDVDMTINLIRKMSPYIYAAGMQSTRLLPDATLIHEAKEKGIVPKDFDWFVPYSNNGLGVARDDFDTLPLYIEHLTPQQINRKLNEFNAILDAKFATFYFFKKTLVSNLKPRNFKKFFTERDKFKRSVTRGAAMLWAALRNKARERHFELGF